MATVPMDVAAMPMDATAMPVMSGRGGNRRERNRSERHGTQQRHKESSHGHLLGRNRVFDIRMYEIPLGSLRRINAKDSFPKT
jgi:hypothetical protein